MGSSARGTRLCRMGCQAAALGLLAIAVSAGHKLGFLADWRLAFAALGLGGLLMAIAALAAGLGLLRSRGSAGDASAAATWAALLAGVAITAINLFGMRSMGGPLIHDISTDTADPPAFVAAIARRAEAGALNGPEYAPETALEQKAAYPDIQPIVLEMPVQQAFGRARAAVEASGWEVIEIAAEEGRIEATATTGWVGFKDDVVVRVRADGRGSRVDVRSKSRVGKGDMGMNARRVRGFSERLLSE